MVTCKIIYVSSSLLLQKKANYFQGLMVMNK